MLARTCLERMGLCSLVENETCPHPRPLPEGERIAEQANLSCKPAVLGDFNQSDGFLILALWQGGTREQPRSGYHVGADLCVCPKRQRRAGRTHSRYRIPFVRVNLPKAREWRVLVVREALAEGEGA